jgi:uroporphyrin-3 C-methyltransferase
MDETPQPAIPATPAPQKSLLSRLMPRELATPLGRIVLVALVFFGWQWWDTRHQVEALSQELAKRLRESDAGSQESRVVAKQARDAVGEAQARLNILEARLQESQNQQVALEALYQELSRGRDDWVLAEVEQILAIASQQLQLAGNVSVALVALQSADARLARSDRPQFVTLRKVLTRDIDRLKSAPNLDLTGLSLKIEQLIGGIDAWPLAFEGRPQENGGSSPPAGQGFWRALGRQAWDEFRQLVRIQNSSRTEAVLLAPEQAFFLRENLKLRLLNARLALLQRDQNGYRQDIRVAGDWIARHFDNRAKPVSNALATLKQLAAAGVSVEPPNVADSLAAVRNFKVSREASRDKASR